MKKYVVVNGSVMEEFVAKVNQLIEEGYEPIGGINALTFVPDNMAYEQMKYHQAMILTERN
jgi:Domain of unknown function (DUF1737)